MTGVSEARRAAVAVIAATVLLGTIGTAAELGPDDVSATTTAAWRTTIGAAVLAAWASRRAAAPWSFPLPPKLVAVAGVAVAANQLAFFEAIDRTGVAVGTTVAIGTIPAAAGLVDLLVHRIRPTLGWVAGVVMAIVGVAVLTGAGEGVVWGGVAFAVVAGAAVPVFGLVAQHLMADRPALTAMATVFGGGAVVLSPLALAGAAEAFGSPAAAATVLYLGAATLAGAFLLWGGGLRVLGLSAVAAIGLLEPAVAATLAVLVLDDSVTTALVAGVAIVIAGVAVASSAVGGSEPTT
ncbi:MAG: DMT family transporter [Acidimicrobiales bacterium]